MAEQSGPHRLVQPPESSGRFRILAVEDMIADRMGQYASGSAPDMAEQARALFALFPSLDRDYLERRVRFETAGDFGVQDLGRSG